MAFRISEISLPEGDRGLADLIEIEPMTCSVP